jgi:hypothetical protein
MAITFELRMPTNLPDPWKRRRSWSGVRTFVDAMFVLAMVTMLISCAVIMWSVWSVWSAI